MEDEEVRQEPPVCSGEELHQVLLDLDRILLSAQTKKSTEAGNVSVYGHPFVDVIRISQHHVRGLAANPR
jgi:hypothetical protein